MRDKLTDTLRIGKVSSIDPIKCTAQVTFEDRENTVSGDLFIIVPFTLKDRAYYMPAIDERVWAYFDPGAPSVGYILGSYYADNRLPPVGDENKTYINYEDETLVEYDKKLHKMTIRIPEMGETSIEIETASDITVKSKGNIKVGSAKEIEVKSVGKMTILSNADISIHSDANIKVDAAGSMTLASTGSMNLSSSASIALKAPIINLNE